MDAHFTISNWKDQSSPEKTHVGMAASGVAGHENQEFHTGLERWRGTKVCEARKAGSGTFVLPTPLISQLINQSINQSIDVSCAFCSGILEYCKPGLFPNWRTMDRSNRVENCRRAMEVAEREFGIPMLISPEDLSSPDLDELSGMTYLSYFMNSPTSPGYKATLRWVRSQIPDENVENFTVHPLHMQLEVQRKLRYTCLFVRLFTWVSWSID